MLLEGCEFSYPIDQTKLTNLTWSMLTRVFDNLNNQDIRLYIDWLAWRMKIKHNWCFLHREFIPQCVGKLLFYYLDIIYCRHMCSIKMTTALQLINKW